MIIITEWNINVIFFCFYCYSKADFVSRVKYNNNLPDIPFDAKFIAYPFESNRSVKLEGLKCVF